jgi:alanyl-tRNA synthetase
MVEIGEGDYSRELCGGTHVRNTAEIGAFRVISETSSAANVRRIEALTGPGAVALLREHDRELEDVATTLRTVPTRAAEMVREREQERKKLQKAARQGGGASAVDVDSLATGAETIGGATVLTAEVSVPDPKALLDVADRLKGKLAGEGVLVLGAAIEGRVSLVVSVAPALVARGLKAGEIVKLAAQVVGGGGGGRDTMAQAGGRDPQKLGEALAAARAAIEDALGGG